jgi:predicted ferric reductase
LTEAVWSGLAIALGLLTALLLTGQWQSASTSVSGALTQVGRWLGAAPAADSRVYWYMARSAGIVAYLLVWGSVAWGLMVTNKVLDGVVKPILTYELHQFLSIAALVAAVFHAFILLGDGYIQFSVLDLVIPFRASYQPVWVGLGILGWYVMAGLVLSFYIKKRIGHRVWRLVHYSSFAVWVMVTIHGVLAGSDSHWPLMQVLYIAAIVSVSFLLTYRILAAKRSAKLKTAH